MEQPNWSGNQLRRLGERLREGTESDDDALSYDAVRRHYSEVAAEVQERIGSHDWHSVLGNNRFEVTSRAKTIDTVREKLQRDRATPLSRVQDLAGVRFEAEMSLSQQQAVAEAISSMFDADPSESLHDLRAHPNSGYRALHVWLKLPQRVEVQVRTHLQGAWANLYEEAGDYFGRDIRYGGVPEDPLAAEIVRSLKKLSVERYARIENLRDVIYQSPTSLPEEEFESLTIKEWVLVSSLDELKEQLRTMGRVGRN